MTDEQLDRLSKLTDLFEKCAKMGGTKGFERIQPLVAKDMKTLLDDIDKEEKEARASQAKVEPKPKPPFKPAGFVPLDETERRV